VYLNEKEEQLPPSWHGTREPKLYHSGTFLIYAKPCDETMLQDFY